MQHRTVGLISMLLGSALVLLVVLQINRYNQSRDNALARKASRVEVVRKKAPPPVERPKPKPPAQTRKALRPAPITPMADLLSGMDFGMPEFDPGQLESLDEQLTTQERNLVMTDETVDQPPRPLRRTAMQYPPQARSRGIEGHVLLSILIDPDGRVEQARVLESQPPGLFDQVARTAIMGWQFEPARYQGMPVRVWARQNIRFELN